MNVHHALRPTRIRRPTLFNAFAREAFYHAPQGHQVPVGIHQSIQRMVAVFTATEGMAKGEILATMTTETLFTPRAPVV